MDDWIEDTMRLKQSGIEARWWVRFLKLFDERGDEASVKDGIRKMAASIGRCDEWGVEVAAIVNKLMQM